ncbi:MAG TPA: Asp-tRNA(Asn)/Glu-tRNA(Gln) amidotransferase subunit GatC, partial [Methanocorpusculum sp.]|nr:Asp-tRNA(Asn)/Glu-tRNA(Gln) amidotransferase subunit GatC [Methanocorpusculum sp.]
SQDDVLHIAKLADVGLSPTEVSQFTEQFNNILVFFDILDDIKNTESIEPTTINIFREDVVQPSLSQEDALRNSHESEKGYIRAPKVI